MGEGVEMRVNLKQKKMEFNIRKEIRNEESINETMISGWEEKIKKNLNMMIFRFWKNWKTKKKAVNRKFSWSLNGKYIKITPRETLLFIFLISYFSFFSPAIFSIFVSLIILKKEKFVGMSKENQTYTCETMGKKTILFYWFK